MLRWLAKFGQRLGFRLGMLLSIAILPIGMISILQTLHLSRQAERAAELAIQGRTAAAAAGERALLQGAISTADALGVSVLAMLDDPTACSRMMSDFVRGAGAYYYAGFTDLEGNNLCGSSNLVQNIAGTSVFQRFIRSPGTHFTAEAEGPWSGMPVVIVQRPLYDNLDLLGLVALSMSQDQLRSTHISAYWSEGARILSFNNAGEPLVGDFPTAEDAMGILPRNMALADMIHRTDTTFSAVSNSGENRVFSVVPVVPDYVYALGSWSPRLTGVAGLNLSRFVAVLFPVALWLVSLAVAFFAVDRLVLRHVRELRGQMRRFALGNRVVPPPVLVTAPGEIRDVSETFHNMARILIRDEAAMEEAVNEKTVLLKEVHHRVKNNLQLIASIINMQSRVIDDPDAKRVLRSVQNRVASLAATYKNLYQAEHLDSVEADQLLRDIIGQMSTASVANEQSIEIDTRLEPLTLLPDQAVPLILLTTEAFTNALKYAGIPEGGERPWVCVRLHRADDGHAELTIENSLGEESPETDGTGLGNQLIEAFAMQLESEAQITTTDGVFRVFLRFLPEARAMLQDSETRRVVLTSAAREGARH